MKVEWPVNYRSARRASAPLTPPAELVGRFVSWRPMALDGTRRPTAYGSVERYDSAARTLTIRVQQPVSAWQPHPYRDATVPLTSGPFTVVSA